MISSAERRPSARPAITSPSWVTASRLTRPAATAPASSPPPAACCHSSQNRRQRSSAAELDLGLSLHVGAQHGRCWPARRSEPRITGCSPGVTVATRSWAAASSRAADPPAELRGQRFGPFRAGVRADSRPVAGGGQTARRPGAVDPAADDADRFGAVGGEDLRRDSGRGAGAQRGDRPQSMIARSSPVPALGEEQRPGDDRQTALGVVGERGHPLQQREALAARGHGAEVAVRRRVEVDLRRHRPLAPRRGARTPAASARSPRAGLTAASTAFASRTGTCATA